MGHEIALAPWIPPATVRACVPRGVEAGALVEAARCAVRQVKASAQDRVPRLPMRLKYDVLRCRFPGFGGQS